MARATTDQALARRARVAELELRGTAPSVIARDLKSDVRTIRADLAILAQERAQDVRLDAERHRLIDAAKLVEFEAWGLFHALPDTDANGRLGALAKVLAAQAQGRTVVGDLANADLERRMAEMEALLTNMLPVASRTARRIA